MIHSVTGIFKMILRLTPLTKLILSGLFSLSAIALTSCGGGGGGNDEPAVSVSIDGNGDLFTNEPYDLTISNAGQISNLSVKYGKTEAVEGDPNRWKYTFDVNLFKNRDVKFPVTETVSFTAEDGTVYEKTVEIILPDPLMKYQWSLYNNGDNEYRQLELDYAPLKGFDINVIDAWNHTDARGRKISGKGTTILFIDKSVDIKHENIKDNITDFMPSKSSLTNYINRGLTPEEMRNDVVNSHGTAVSGIAAANGRNHLGHRGIAYDAKMVSFDFFKAVKYSEHNDIYSDNSLDQVDVINISLGEHNNIGNSKSLYLAIESLYSRNIPLIQSAGNYYGDAITEVSTDCLDYGSLCHFSQTSIERTARASVVVTSSNSLGSKSSYSSTGVNAWITAMGGELGFIPDLLKLYLGLKASAAVVSNLSSYDCADYWRESGLSYTKYTNIFDYYESPWYALVDPEYKCRYTAAMNGTSSAAPHVTGVVALMKQLKKDLTIPQIKYILAKTARNDNDFATMALQDITGYDQNRNEILLDNGWLKKNDNLKFSSWYGFGLVDAGGAVELAEKCSENSYCAERARMPVYIQSDSTVCTPTQLSVNEYKCTIKDFFNYDENDVKTSEFSGKFEIENVELTTDQFKFSSSQTAGNTACDIGGTDQYHKKKPFIHLQLEIQSPDEVLSIIKPYYSYWADYTPEGNSSYNNKEIYLTSNSFYLDEMSSDNSEWTFKVRSACNIDTSMLNRFKLKIYGYQK